MSFSVKTIGVNEAIQQLGSHEGGLEAFMNEAVSVNDHTKGKVQTLITNIRQSDAYRAAQTNKCCGTRNQELIKTLDTIEDLVSQVEEKYGLGGSKCQTVSKVGFWSAVTTAGAVVLAKTGALGSTAAAKAATVTGTVYTATIANLPAVNTTAISGAMSSTLSTVAPAITTTSLLTTAGTALLITAAGLALVKACQRPTPQPATTTPPNQ